MCSCCQLTIWSLDGYIFDLASTNDPPSLQQKVGEKEWDWEGESSKTEERINVENETNGERDKYEYEKQTEDERG